MSEIVEQLEKIKCTLDKKHKLRVKSLKGNKFELWCPDCKEKFNVDNTLKGEIKPKVKK